MRSVWKVPNALSTRLIWVERTFASSAHVDEVGERREEGDWDAGGVGVAVWVGVAVGLAGGCADADGLGDASVIVIVVAPFAADPLTSDPDPVGVPVALF